MKAVQYDNRGSFPIIGGSGWASINVELFQLNWHGNFKNDATSSFSPDFKSTLWELSNDMKFVPEFFWKVVKVKKTSFLFSSWAIFIFGNFNVCKGAIGQYQSPFNDFICQWQYWYQFLYQEQYFISLKAGSLLERVPRVPSTLSLSFGNGCREPVLVRAQYC